MRLFGVITLSGLSPKEQMRLPVVNRLYGIKQAFAMGVPAENTAGSCSSEHLHYIG